MSDPYVSEPIILFPPGSVGASVNSASVPCDDYRGAWLQFIVEAVGTTISYSWQGSLDPPTLSDGASTFKNIVVALNSTGTTATSGPQTQTTVGTYTYLLWTSSGHFWRKFRLAVTTNTGITYNARLMFRR